MDLMFQINTKTKVPMISMQMLLHQNNFSWFYSHPHFLIVDLQQGTALFCSLKGRAFQFQ